MKKTIRILFFLFCSINCFAQFSKTHYIPPLTAQDNLTEEQYLYISTPNTSDVNFKIIEIGNNIITGTVSNSSPYVHYIGRGNTSQLLTPKTSIGIVQNKGYIIEADDLIYVSVRLTAAKSGFSYAHAGGIVSKGNSALGKEFRLGAMLNPLFDNTLLNFASILSTENGTKVTISNIPAGTILANGTTITGPINITLNKNESYILALENSQNYSNSNSNSSKMIGALVQSDKPVVVNSGSFGGSNSTATSNGIPVGRDVGFDQIVPFEKTGKEYIFVKGNGTDELERVLLIAHLDNTQVFVNGNTTPNKTLNKGEYIVLDGNQFSGGNMYVTTSENVFAYQSIAGTSSPANQNMFFVPPINCSTPNTVDNIPFIESIGGTTYSGNLNIVTETGALVKINGVPTTAFPVSITGNSGFVRYTINGLSGNVSVKSNKQVYVSYFGTNSNATYGGYYSGFDLKPEIISEIKVGVSTNCIPNVNLKISTLSSYDTFQWFKNDVEIPGETTNHYTPTTPGFYKVRGSISACGTTVFSDNLPVSDCPTNIDNDLANDNIDIDNDNDGITNCTESYGNQNINISNAASGIVMVGSYSNSFTGNITTSGVASTAPFTGNTDGSFITEVPAGKGNSVTYKINFINPISTGIEYITTANTTDLLNADAEYIVNSDINKTITVLNPNNQLLIDTNYDGIYETGITQYSSFEIRFRLNSTTPLTAGTGTFQFLTHLSNSISFTHKNLSDTNSNRVSLKLFATCIPKDSDSDGIPDQLDFDSDNDGIPDFIEIQKKPKALSNTDTDLDGLDEIFEPTTTPIDTDNDGIPDYLDLDSDNDGIYDLVESGSNAPDVNKNGIIDGTAFGSNGLSNSLETSPDSGVLKYTVLDSDEDGIKNHTETDSDNDGCNDVIEAGFTDPNFDGILGNAPVTVNSYGIVTSSTNGYTTPNGNYIIATPIIITKQPENQIICELQNASFTIESNAETFQWQLSTDGGNIWNSLGNNLTYSGVNTATLLVTKASTTMNGYQYRVLLDRTNNACGLTSTNSTKLTIYALPVINSPITIVQCDDDTDGITNFNLTEKNSFVSSNSTNETFTYYTTLTGANTKDASKLISNPLAYTSSNKSIWTRVENSNGCFSVAQLDLKVSTTQINSNFKKTFKVCDDYIDTVNDDKDGITSFDFSSIKNDIYALLPSPSTNYGIKFYINEADALAETNAITDPANYRNTTPNQQDVWVRVESNLDNACFGLGPYITLQVNPKPNIDTNESKKDNYLVCSNLPNFFVKLNAGIIGNTSPSTYNYVWSKDGSIIPGETKETLDVNEEGKYTVEVSTLDDNSCSRTRTITVTASDIASLDSVTISDLSESNTVEANVSGNGDYEYSIDLPNGPFQDANLLENVRPGIHDLYVHDKNGCGTVSRTIAVLGIPKFFTPNNDGYNDYWNIKGANETFNSGAKIFIYDRYGKVIKQITASSNGWDGTYSGNPMPADDYWYSIKLEDGREAKGHFSLKR